MPGLHLAARGNARDAHHHSSDPARQASWDRAFGANVVSTRSRWFSRAPARCRLHRAACCIWSLRSRSVSSARPRACRLSLARIPGELILRVSVWLWPGITQCAKRRRCSVAIEQVIRLGSFWVLTPQAPSNYQSNLRTSFSPRFELLSFHTP